MEKIRKTQRRPRSCYECYRRRIKCNKKIPCDQCILRDIGDRCHREKVEVNGIIYNDKGKNDELSQLRSENEELKSSLRWYKSHYGDFSSPKPTNRRNKVDMYGTGLHVLTRTLSQNRHQILAPHHDFSKLSEFIVKDFSFELVEYHMTHLLFLHTAVYARSFLQEHEEYWSTDKEKHICNDVSRTIDEYLWMAIWYAILSMSLFILDDRLIYNRKISKYDLFSMAHLTAHASLECLHRGQYLFHPNVKSIQAYCILGSCFHSFLGVALQNSMLPSMIYMAEALNMHRMVCTDDMSSLDFEFGCRLWWVLVIHDWLEAFGRKRVISKAGFTTRIPRNVREDDLINFFPPASNDFEVITYNKIMSEYAEIKNRLYFDNKIEHCELDLEYLNTAIQEMESLFALVSDNLIKKSSTSSENRFQKYLLTGYFNHELLELNRKLINFKSKELWISENRGKCLFHAIEVLKLFANNSFPFYFKKIWFSCEQCVSAAVYVLLDFFTMASLQPNDEVLDIVLKQLPILRELEYTHNSARVGVRLIRTLLSLISRKKEGDQLTITELENYSRDFEAMPKIYNNSSMFDNDDMPDIIQDYIRNNEWLDFFS